MNSFDVEELREHIEDLNEKIKLMELLERSTDNVIKLQNDYIKVLQRQVKYLEDWVNNNAPNFDFNEYEKFRQN